jgi:hypothetical protein
MSRRSKSCPRCGGPLPQYGMQGVSLSRRDNRTDICSKCGMEEAIEDMRGCGAHEAAQARIFQTGRPYPRGYRTVETPLTGQG